MTKATVYLATKNDQFCVMIEGAPATDWSADREVALAAAAARRLQPCSLFAFDCDAQAWFNPRFASGRFSSVPQCV